MKHKYLVFILLGVLCLTMVAGCNCAPSPGASSTVDTVSGSDMTVDPGASLAQLREKMSASSQTMAVAYLGFTEDRDAVDLRSWLEAHCSALCEEYPFLATLDKEHIIGNGSGELYCIVPLNRDASVAVNGAVMNEVEPSYETPLYRSETGEPVLLWCNNSGFEPDVQVNVVESNGNVLTWSPQLDDTLCVDQLVNDNGEELIYDFSPYSQLLATDYARRVQNGWSLPKVDDLLGNTWIWEGFLKDDRYVSYYLTFDEWTVDVRWNDGIDQDDHEYNDAPYELTYDETFAVLEIDFREFAGKMYFDLLINQESDVLYTMLDISNGEADIGSEPLYRALIKTTAPDPMEMVGTWVRSSWMVEGYEEEDGSGKCIIAINGDAEEDLVISYTDQEFPDSDYKGKALKIRPGELYTNCGNRLWLADVDYVGRFDTTFCITLLEDGRLLLQNYYLLDGAPTVSYEWFQRSE